MKITTGKITSGKVVLTFLEPIDIHLTSEITTTDLAKYVQDKIK